MILPADRLNDPCIEPPRLTDLDQDPENSRLTADGSRPADRTAASMNARLSLLAEANRLRRRDVSLTNDRRWRIRKSQIVPESLDPVPTISRYPRTGFAHGKSRREPAGPVHRMSGIRTGYQELDVDGCSVGVASWLTWRSGLTIVRPSSQRGENMPLCFRRMLGRGVLFACAVSALALWATPGRAVPLSFVLTGDDSASWVLDSNPAPDGFIAGTSFWFSGVGPAPFLIFWSASVVPPGGFTASDDSFASSGNVLDLTGPALYTGPEDAPVFLTGTFALLGNPGSISDGHVDTLTISATPLPAAWVLFLTTIAGLFGWRRARMSPA